MGTTSSAQNIRRLHLSLIPLVDALEARSLTNNMAFGAFAASNVETRLFPRTAYHSDMMNQTVLNSSHQRNPSSVDLHSSVILERFFEKSLPVSSKKINKDGSAVNLPLPAVNSTKTIPITFNNTITISNSELKSDYLVTQDRCTTAIRFVTSWR